MVGDFFYYLPCLRLRKMSEKAPNTPADLYLQGEKNKTKNIKTTY